MELISDLVLLIIDGYMTFHTKIGTIVGKNITSV